MRAGVRLWGLPARATAARSAKESFGRARVGEGVQRRRGGHPANEAAVYLSVGMVGQSDGERE